MLATPRLVTRRRGFTLIELLAVILIIGLVSVVAIPTVIPALNHRQTSEAARVLQGALVGARDKAIHDGRPSGIRLIPDPAWPIVWTAAGTIDPNQPLAYSRIIPVEPAPEYQEGLVATYPGQSYAALTPAPCLVLEESKGRWQGGAIDPASGKPKWILQPNSPTSWFWNIRVGDKVQVNNAGPWYTVVGPLVAGPGQGNPEGFVNAGDPGVNPWSRVLTAPDGVTTATVTPEFLFLVDGKDDDRDGFVDNSWDGVDNDGDGLIDESTCPSSTTGEWETEAWQGSLASTAAVDSPYAIRRRPVPTRGAGEIGLPTRMVVDATSWRSTRERSRLPVNPYDGTVEILVNPDGTASPSMPYGTPSSMDMAGAFLHFFLAERQDVAAPGSSGPPYLPIAAPGGNGPPYTGPTLKGEHALLTLFARSGRIVVNIHPPFDNPSAPADGQGYDPGYPFREAQQGVSGGP